MKFVIIGYTIDTATKSDFKKVSDELTLITLLTFPKLQVQDVHYSYNNATNTASVIFVRNSKHSLTPSWIKEDDCQLITGMEQEYFYPAPYGGKNKGYFTLMSKNGAWYATDDSVKDFFMDYLTKNGVKDVMFNFNDQYLEIKVIGQ